MRTSDRDYAKYVAAWRRRFALDEEKRRAREAQALRVADRCARILVETFGAERVYLFGSLAGHRVFGLESDIDLAVEGLSASQYFKALSAICQACDDEFAVDLVSLEDCKPHIRQAARAEGRLLHERVRQAQVRDQVRVG